ncbi:hypothetical protein SCUCBS95973_006670 [Sporothrix curviconia]|uniref:JmjC domain-containing protein n=1 Tax=Sporothrix curviconia TaxID=1260050 RepID=A0ABP0C978_9PEZI
MTTRRPQHRRGGSMKVSKPSKKVMKTTATTTTAAAAAAATAAATKTTNGSRIRPSDPRLKLSLRAFHQILPRKKRPRQDTSALMPYGAHGAHGDIFALLAAAAAAAAATTSSSCTALSPTSTQSQSQSQSQSASSPTTPSPPRLPPSSDLGLCLYDPSSPWGVRDILYDPALPLPQGVASSACGPHSMSAGKPAPVPRPPTNANGPAQLPLPQLPPLPPSSPNWQPRKARFFGPGLREALRLIPSEVPVRVQLPPSTPNNAAPVIKQDPQATERGDFLTDRRFVLAEMPVTTVPEATTTTTTATPAAKPTMALMASMASKTGPMVQMTPAATNGKRRRKPSMKAQLLSAAIAKPATPAANPIEAPVATPVIPIAPATSTITPTHPPLPPLPPPPTTPSSSRAPPTRERCCPTEVPMILHMILDQTGHSLQPHMVDQYLEHVGSLCADHLAKYQRLKESIGHSNRHSSTALNGASSPAPAATPKTLATKAAPPSSKRKKAAPARTAPAAAVAPTTPIVPAAPPQLRTLPSPIAPAANGRPVVNIARDDAYRRQMRAEIEQRFDTVGAETTHGGVTNRVIYNLLGVAEQPNGDLSKGPLDVHLLSGDEALNMLDAVSPHEPVVTQHEQMFQWRPHLRPIAELFRRMENLDRRVSVQVPSRHCMDDSFESRDLTQVRDRFLASEGKEEEDPWNILDLRSPLPAAVLPRFLTNENCQLLPRLRDEVLNPSRAERDTAAREQWNEWRDVLEWVLLSQGGHNTSPHTDSHGLATWITVQEGLFGFGWLSHPSSDDRAAWTARPHEFTGGKWCFLVLEPGQTVFFNSGTVHFVFRLRSQATLALGGHVLQWSGIERWLAVVAAQMQNPHITNEDMEWSAPRYVRVVARLVAARLQSGRGVDDMGGEAAVRRLLVLLHDFDERYIKDKPSGAGGRKPKKKKHRVSHK